MPVASAVIECAIRTSFRTRQVLGMFGLPASAKSRREFTVEIPDLAGDWRIGAIVGPSGSGKSTIAHQVFGRRFYTRRSWPRDQAIVDAFPKALSIKEITATLTSVGFSSPPAWLRPYAKLSTGEQFRCDLARALLAGGAVVAYDEFTSVVDRTVAKVASVAIAKTIRQDRVPLRRFVAVTCHYDILPWLTPDWVCDMATCQLARGCLQRPRINLEIFRCDRAAWETFAPHHYLTPDLHQSAECYLTTWRGQAVAFIAIINAAGRIRRRRVTRLVVLPDFQGVGIGRATLDAVARYYFQQGNLVTIATGHPAMVAALGRARNWVCVGVKKSPQAHKGHVAHGAFARGSTGCAASPGRRGSFGRLTTQFVYRRGVRTRPALDGAGRKSKARAGKPGPCIQGR